MFKHSNLFENLPCSKRPKARQAPGGSRGPRPAASPGCFKHSNIQTFEYRDMGEFKRLNSSSNQTKRLV